MTSVGIIERELRRPDGTVVFRWQAPDYMPLDLTTPEPILGPVELWRRRLPGGEWWLVSVRRHDGRWMPPLDGV